MFSIDVFERRPAVALGDWLRSDDVMPAGASVTPVQIEGAQEALRVALRQQLAPNEFVYVSTGSIRVPVDTAWPAWRGDARLVSTARLAPAARPGIAGA